MPEKSYCTCCSLGCSAEAQAALCSRAVEASTSTFALQACVNAFEVLVILKSSVGAGKSLQLFLLDSLSVVLQKTEYII